MKNLIFYLVLFALHGSSNITNAQWVRVGVSQINSIVFSLAVSQDSASHATLFAGTSWISYRTTDNGATWEHLGLNIVLSLYVHGPYIFASPSGFSPPYGVYRSTNNGVNWAAFNNGFPAANDNPSVFASSGNNLFAGTFESGVYLSTNNGENWTAVNNGFPLNRQVKNLEFSGTNLFAVTSIAGVFLTTNNGLNWNNVNNGLPAISSIAVIGQRVFASGQNVFVTTNNGSSWEPVNTSISYVSLFSYGSNLFAGGNSKIYLSTDYGTTWTSVSNGIPIQSGRISEIAISQDGSGNKYIFAGTDNNGLWRRPLSEIISVQNISTEIPDHFRLNQNFPNPFNPITNIEFSIPKQQNVKITVYDSQGKEIAFLLDQRLSAGTYKVDFDGASYSSGVYFYKLETENFVETRSMVLLK